MLCVDTLRSFACGTHTAASAASDDQQFRILESMAASTVQQQQQALSDGVKPIMFEVGLRCGRILDWLLAVLYTT